MIKVIDLWLGRLCLTVAGLSVCAMALVAFIDSIGRKLNHPLYGGSEMVTFALVTFFFSALPLVVRDNSHIRVGLFADLYKNRLSRIESYFTGTLEVVALLAFCWLIFDQVQRLERFGTVSLFFELPLAPIISVAAFFCAISIWFAAHNVLLINRDAGLHPHSIPDDSEEGEALSGAMKGVMSDAVDHNKDEE